MDFVRKAFPNSTLPSIHMFQKLKPVFVSSVSVAESITNRMLNYFLEAEEVIGVKEFHFRIVWDQTPLAKSWKTRYAENYSSGFFM